MGFVFEENRKFDGLGGLDMAGYVEEYNKFLADMEAQYRCDMERFQRKRLEEDQREEEGVVEEESPKRQLSRLAKRSPQSIPKDHAAAVDLDKSIHVSPEARAIFEGIIEGPSTSTGITHPYPSVMRHPIPRLEYDDDEDEDEDEDTGETEADEEVSEVPYATMETCHDHGHKDPLFVEKYNEMLDTSLKMEAVKQDRVAVEDLGDVDVANISGEDLDMLLAGLQQVDWRLLRKKSNFMFVSRTHPPKPKNQQKRTNSRRWNKCTRWSTPPKLDHHGLQSTWRTCRGTRTSRRESRHKCRRSKRSRRVQDVRR